MGLPAALWTLLCADTRFTGNPIHNPDSPHALWGLLRRRLILRDSERAS